MAFLLRWCENVPGEFTGVIDERVWRLRQVNPETPVELHRSCLTRNELSDILNSRLPQSLLNYFRLDVSIDSLFTAWLEQDAVMRNFFSQLPKDAPVGQFRGLRLLRQNPREVVFAFITSANNNVARISRLLVSLSDKFGAKLPGARASEFPTIEALSKPGIEDELREMGFGYRAKYIP